MSQRHGANLSRVRCGHGLEYAPRHALEELANKEHGEIPSEEREEDESRDSHQRADDGPAVAITLRDDTRKLRMEKRMISREYQ